jgi:hypothetical protein
MAAANSKRSAACDAQLCEYGPLRFAGTEDGDRHPVLDHAVTPEAASQPERFDAIARKQRDLPSHSWILSEQIYHSCVRPPAVGKHQRAKTNRRARPANE